MRKIAKLQKAIKEQHGCDSEHLLTRHVRETFQDKVVWEGDVEIFQLEHHQAIVAYAWSDKTGSGNTRYVTVLGIPPVYTAVDAVRTYVEHTLTAQSGKKMVRTGKLLDRIGSDIDTQTADMIERYRGRRDKVADSRCRSPRHQP
jgi:hypothetical protein